MQPALIREISTSFWADLLNHNLSGFLFDPGKKRSTNLHFTKEMHGADRNRRDMRRSLTASHF